MKKLLILFSSLFIFGLILLFGPNIYVKQVSKNKILNNYSDIKDVDAIVVLGAGVWDNGPSPMLKDRLEKAIELYNEGISKKIIMTGDHGRKDYDEVNVMKEYVVERGIPSSDVFMDHAGFSTYDSMYRAKYIFNAKKIVIVSQEYHLYRAIYIANKLGIEAYGVPALKIKYSGQLNRDLREILARDKDFFKCIFKPKSKYLGEEISLEGSGDITNDKKE